MIISDENMIFSYGTICSQILYDTSQKQKKKLKPFYLLTAYEDEYLKANSSGIVKFVISKPLSKDIAKKLIENK